MYFIKIYFNYLGNWKLLNNETDFIDGYLVKDFFNNLRDNDYKINQQFLRIIYNQDKYIIHISNLFFIPDEV